MVHSALAVLYPAIAEASRRVNASAVGLIDVDGSAVSTLSVDRVQVSYSTGLVLGDPSSPLQVAAQVKGDGSIPVGALPEVVFRVGVRRHPVPAGENDTALTADMRPHLLQGDPLDLLPAVIEGVPKGALPVVITTWALSRWGLVDRLRFLHCLGDAAVGRRVAWVSAEGVGVAPAVPTLGDRRASGHSIIGLGVFDHASLQMEAVGRCWSQGRWLMWLS
jgi:hypothetical protein